MELHFVGDGLRCREICDSVHGHLGVRRVRKLWPQGVSTQGCHEWQFQSLSRLDMIESARKAVISRRDLFKHSLARLPYFAENLTCDRFTLLDDDLATVP